MPTSNNSQHDCYRYIKQQNSQIKLYKCRKGIQPDTLITVRTSQNIAKISASKFEILSIALEICREM